MLRLYRRCLSSSPSPSPIHSSSLCSSSSFDSNIFHGNSLSSPSQSQSLSHFLISTSLPSLFTQKFSSSPLSYSYPSTSPFLSPTHSLITHSLSSSLSLSYSYSAPPSSSSSWNFNFSPQRWNSNSPQFQTNETHDNQHNHQSLSSSQSSSSSSSSLNDYEDNDKNDSPLPPSSTSSFSSSSSSSSSPSPPSLSFISGGSPPVSVDDVLSLLTHIEDEDISRDIHLLSSDEISSPLAIVVKKTFGIYLIDELPKKLVEGYIWDKPYEISNEEWALMAPSKKKALCVLEGLKRLARNDTKRHRITNFRRPPVKDLLTLVSEVDRLGGKRQVVMEEYGMSTTVRQAVADVHDMNETEITTVAAKQHRLLHDPHFIEIYKQIYSKHNEIERTKKYPKPKSIHQQPPPDFNSKILLGKEIDEAEEAEESYESEIDKLLEIDTETAASISRKKKNKTTNQKTKIKTKTPEKPKTQEEWEEERNSNHSTVNQNSWGEEDTEKIHNAMKGVEEEGKGDGDEENDEMDYVDDDEEEEQSDMIESEKLKSTSMSLDENATESENDFDQFFLSSPTVNTSEFITARKRVVEEAKTKKISISAQDIHTQISNVEKQMLQGREEGELEEEKQKQKLKEYYQQELKDQNEGSDIDNFPFSSPEEFVSYQKSANYFPEPNEMTSNSVDGEGDEDDEESKPMDENARSHSPLEDQTKRQESLTPEKGKVLAVQIVKRSYLDKENNVVEYTVREDVYDPIHSARVFYEVFADLREFIVTFPTVLQYMDFLEGTRESIRLAKSEGIDLVEAKKIFDHYPHRIFDAKYPTLANRWRYKEITPQEFTKRKVQFLQEKINVMTKANMNIPMDLVQLLEEGKQQVESIEEEELSMLEEEEKVKEKEKEDGTPSTPPTDEFLDDPTYLFTKLGFREDMWWLLEHYLRSSFRSINRSVRMSHTLPLAERKEEVLRQWGNVLHSLSIQESLQEEPSLEASHGENDNLSQYEINYHRDSDPKAHSGLEGFWEEFGRETGDVRTPIQRLMSILQSKVAKMLLKMEKQQGLVDTPLQRKYLIAQKLYENQLKLKVFPSDIIVNKNILHERLMEVGRLLKENLSLQKKLYSQRPNSRNKSQIRKKRIAVDDLIQSLQTEKERLNDKLHKKHRMKQRENKETTQKPKQFE